MLGDYWRESAPATNPMASHLHYSRFIRLRSQIHGLINAWTGCSGESKDGESPKPLATGQVSSRRPKRTDSERSGIH